MSNTKKTARTIAPEDHIFIVVEKKLFPDSTVVKAEIVSIEVSNTGFGPGNNKKIRVFNNGAYEAPVAGNPSPEVGDVVFDEEMAKEIQRLSMDRTRKAAEENLQKAERDVEAVKNYLKTMNTVLEADSLNFDKEGVTLEIVDELAPKKAPKKSY